MHKGEALCHEYLAIFLAHKHACIQQQTRNSTAVHDRLPDYRMMLILWRPSQTLRQIHQYRLLLIPKSPSSPTSKRINPPPLDLILLPLSRFRPIPLLFLRTRHIDSPKAHRTARSLKDTFMTPVLVHKHLCARFLDQILTRLCRCRTCYDVIVRVA